MAANNALRLTDINFDGIKRNLRSFLGNQTELQDYDYDSSTMQIILDLLAYNTYINSFYLNMVGNEMYLDSAQIRNNVVSRAKMLGYTPRSARGPTATVRITVTPTGSPDTITLAKNTEFTTTIDGQPYTFVNPNAETIVNDNGTYTADVNIVEGKPLTFRYLVSSVQPQRYIIPNDNVDTRSIGVTVQQSTANTALTTYTLADNLTEVTSDSYTYFIQENEDQKYELVFGDGVLGRELVNGNIINISYRVCNGAAAQGAAVFNKPSSIGGYTNFTLTTVTAASGGGDQESIDSIKFNAPKQYTAQNRAVTAGDYKSIILSEFGDVLQTINVWGGEENTPPQYGRVYISAKPYTGLLLSTLTKERIVEFLQTKKMLTVEPIVVDATYLYIEPTVTVKYSPNNTDSSGSQIANGIQAALVAYENNSLGLFGNTFIKSDLIVDIDNVNDAITSVDIDMKLSRRLVPSVGSVADYVIPFNHQLLDISSGVVLPVSPEAHPGQGLTLTSSQFSYDGYDNVEMDDDGFQNVRFFYRNPQGVKVFLNRRAGSINYTTGVVDLNDINITAYEGDYIDIRVVPIEYDISPVRNQIILLSNGTIRVRNNNTGRTEATLTRIPLGGDNTDIQDYSAAYSIY